MEEIATQRKEEAKLHAVFPCVLTPVAVVSRTNTTPPTPPQTFYAYTFKIVRQERSYNRWFVVSSQISGLVTARLTRHRCRCNRWFSEAHNSDMRSQGSYSVTVIVQRSDIPSDKSGDIRKGSCLPWESVSSPLSSSKRSHLVPVQSVYYDKLTNTLPRTSIERDHKNLSICKKGQPSVAVKIEGPNQPLYGTFSIFDSAQYNNVF